MASPTGWFLRFGSAALCLGALCASARAQAGAGLDACGNIYVEAQAECEVVPPGAQCEAMCVPVSVEAICAVDLAVDCRAGCNKLPSASCTGGCQADCEADCRVDPGKFDCQANCGAECAGDCSGRCSTASNKSQCMASCEGSCSASCDAACNVRAPSADCTARCQASCSGACEVDPNFDCQLDCQTRGRAACEARLEGGCKVKCKQQQGALFCDGQFVDHGDNLQQCIDALRAELAAHVMGEASGSSSCSGGTCTATGQAKVSSDCSVSNPGAPQSFLGWLLPLAALGLLIHRQRTRATKPARARARSRR